MPTRPARIVLVDDDPISSTIIRRVLQGPGVMLTTLPSGPRAVTAVTDAAPELVIIDLDPPRFDAPAVLVALAALTTNRPRRIIGITEQVESAPAGADALYVKPLHYLDLVEEVKALVAGAEG